MLCFIVQVGLLQHTAECALAVTFLQLRQGAAEGRTPEVALRPPSDPLTSRLLSPGQVA